MRHLLRTLASSLALGALLLAGCSGDDDATPATTAPATADAAQDAEADPFCVAYRDLEQRGEALNAETAEDYAAAVDDVAEGSAQLTEAAPDEISDEVALMVEGIEATRAAVAEADTETLEEVQAASDEVTREPRYVEAAGTVSAWVIENCAT